MARRKNATFTLDRTGDRTLIKAFYDMLSLEYPGNTPVPIPPESHIHPKHNAETQAFIFADFAVRKIAPLVFRASRVAGFERYAAQFERLDPITNPESVRDAADAADAALAAANRAGFADSAGAVAVAAVRKAARAARNVARTAADAAYAANFNVADFAVHAAANAAELDNEATWAAVNEMLQAL